MCCGFAAGHLPTELSQLSLADFACLRGEAGQPMEKNR